MTIIWIKDYIVKNIGTSKQNNFTTLKYDAVLTKHVEVPWYGN